MMADNIDVHRQGQPSPLLRAPEGIRYKSNTVKKVLPKSRTEDAEREFWASHDSVGYIDRRKGKRVTLPNLKPSSQTI
jgi:hypothetical protein